MVRPSCPALVIHEDDAFRKKLIAALDVSHFSVTVAEDGDGAIELLSTRKFNVVLIGLDLAAHKGMRSTGYLQREKSSLHCGVLILGESNPELRTFAPWADETLLKPVDPAYVAARAQSYCDCN